MEEFINLAQDKEDGMSPFQVVLVVVKPSRNEIRKILFIGDKNSGKTSLRTRLLGGEFTKGWISHSKLTSNWYSVVQQEIYDSVGADFKSVSITDSDENNPKEYHITIWDLLDAPDPEYVNNIVYMSTNVAIIVFDSSTSDFKLKIEKWIESFLQSVYPENESDYNISAFPRIMICANKIDTRTTEQKRSLLNKGEKFAQQLSEKYLGKENAVKFFAVSALTGENIEDLFNSAIRLVL